MNKQLTDRHTRRTAICAFSARLKDKSTRRAGPFHEANGPSDPMCFEGARLQPRRPGVSSGPALAAGRIIPSANTVSQGLKRPRENSCQGRKAGFKRPVAKATSMFCAGFSSLKAAAPSTAEAAPFQSLAFIRFPVRAIRSTRGHTKTVILTKSSLEKD